MTLGTASGTFRGYGSGPTGGAGRPRAQPQEHLRRDPPQPADRHHRPLGLGEVLARVRYDLRRGAAALRRVALGVRAAVPRADGKARRRRHRGALARHLDRAEDAPARIRARPSAPSPRSTTTCACSGPAPASRTAPTTARPVTRQSAAQITETVLGWPEETRIEVLAPMVRGRKGEFRDLFEDVRKRGFVRVRVDGETYDLGDVPALNRRQNHDIAVVVDRLVVRRRRPVPAQRLDRDRAQGGRRRGRGGAARRRTERSVVFSERFACPVCGLSLPELEPRQFSFNSPFGACPDCHGVGTRREVNAELILGDPSISILEGVILPWGEPSGYLRKVVLPDAGQGVQVRSQRALGPALSESARQALLHGAPGRFRFQTDGARGQRASTRPSGKACSGTSSAATANRPATRCASALEEFMVEQPCQTCGGKRLKPESLAVLVHGRSIGDVVDLPVERALEFFEGVPLRPNGRQGLDPEIAGPILKEVSDRLRFLRDVGLDYLTLGRARDLALRRRDPADPARDPDRLAAGRRALHPRRAEHRPAPARQRAAARARCAGCATWATPSSSSSTTRTPSAAPIT